MLTRVLWARVERAKSGESEEKSICVGRSVVSCECVGEEKGSSSGRELRGTDMLLLLLLSLLTASFFHAHRSASPGLASAHHPLQAREAGHGLRHRVRLRRARVLHLVRHHGAAYQDAHLFRAAPSKPSSSRRATGRTPRITPTSAGTTTAGERSRCTRASEGAPDQRQRAPPFTFYPMTAIPSCTTEDGERGIPSR
jgi:hypothetical protein